MDNTELEIRLDICSYLMDCQLQDMEELNAPEMYMKRAEMIKTLLDECRKTIEPDEYERLDRADLMHKYLNESLDLIYQI